METRRYCWLGGEAGSDGLPEPSKGPPMTTKIPMIAIALASLASLALLLPVLGMVLLGLLTLVVPMLLVLTPVLVPLSIVFLIDRLRDNRQRAGVATTESVRIGAPALHASAR